LDVVQNIEEEQRSIYFVSNVLYEVEGKYSIIEKGTLTVV